MGGDNDFNVQAMITRLMWTIWTSLSAVRERPLNLITHSLTHLSPGRRQAITWTNVGILLIEPLGTNFSEISIGIQTFSFKKMHLNMSSAKWRPFFLGLNVVINSDSGHDFVPIRQCAITWPILTVIGIWLILLLIVLLLHYQRVIRDNKLFWIWIWINQLGL